MRALRRALRKYAPPQISNTDQGVQVTSAGWINVLTQNRIAISMDGRGRVFTTFSSSDSGLSLKYEEVYLHEYRSVTEASQAIDAYFCFYNEQRPHRSLGKVSPAAV